MTARFLNVDELRVPREFPGATPGVALAESPRQDPDHRRESGVAPGHICDEAAATRAVEAQQAAGGFDRHLSGAQSGLQEPGGGFGAGGAYSEILRDSGREIERAARHSAQRTAKTQAVALC